MGDGGECCAAITGALFVGALVLIFRRMPARFDPLPPNIDRQKVVQFESDHRRAATYRQSDDTRAIGAPGEVAFPSLTARIEEFDAAPRDRIAPMSLNAFESIAEPAGQPKILFVVGSAEGLGVNVLHFKQAEDVSL